MAHKHPVYDTDKHFVIDPITKKISTESPKLVLAQHSHNAERFTFEIPKEVEGHDMSACNLVEIHYQNIEAANKSNKSADIYRVTDLQTGTDETSDIVFGSWLIDGNATQYVGGLIFAVRFACIAEDGTVDYSYPTLTYSAITVGETIWNSETIANEHPEILAQFEARIAALEKGGGNPGKDGEDGFSPVVAVEEIEGGHRVSITDKDSTKSFDVMDGKDGKDGFGGVSELSNFIANTDIAHLYDETTGAYYTVVRVYKQKIDGTYQYPFVYAPNGADSGNKSTYDMTVDDGWLLAINSGVFNTSTRKPDGIVIQNGVVIQNTPTATHSQCKPLTIDRDGKLGYAEYNADANQLVENGIVSAVCGFIPIIIDYNAVPQSEWNSVSHYTENAQRQIIGQWGNGDYAIITCEGRGFHNSDGWTIAEAQTICRKHGLKFAYNLDGGGSTETMLGLKPVNTIYENATGRIVPTFIVFNGTNSFLREKTLISISAVYSGGSVPDGMPVNDLSGIEVIAYYSDGTSNAVTDYALTGTIAEGDNTITVIYGGKTTTFTVTGEKVDPTAHVVLVNKVVTIYDNIGYATFNSDAPYRICAVSQYNAPKMPIESNSQLTGKMSDYAPIALPDDATAITVTCPGLMAAVTLWKTDGALWTRTGDSGWMMLNGQKYILPTDTEYTHYVVNFRKSDYGDIAPDTDTSGISIVIEQKDDEPDFSEMGNLYRLPSETVFSGDDYIDTGVKLNETDIDFTIAFSVTPGTQISEISQIFNCQKEMTGYPGICFSCHRASANYRLASSEETNTTYIPKTTTDPFKVVITHRKGTGLFVMKHLYNGSVMNGGGNDVAFSSFICDANFVIGAWQNIDGSKGRYWVGTMHDFFIDDYVWDDTIINAYLK